MYQLPFPKLHHILPLLLAPKSWYWSLVYWVCKMMRGVNIFLGRNECVWMFHLWAEIEFKIYCNILPTLKNMESFYYCILILWTCWMHRAACLKAAWQQKENFCKSEPKIVRNWGAGNLALVFRADIRVREWEWGSERESTAKCQSQG